jgi:nucleoside-diphosphate-sugar epimerase
MLEDIKKIYNNLIEKNDFSFFCKKKILITGASGLVGANLVLFFSLLKKKYPHHLTAWVGSKPDQLFENLFNNCEVYVADITQSDSFSYFLNKNQKFDIIVHAAGYGQPIKFLEDQTKTIEINTFSTKKLFDLIKEGGTYSFFSTSEIYSGNENDEITEDMIGTTTPQHPRACYIESKKCGETLCHIMAASKNVNLKILRLSLAYGPLTKKHDTRAINSFIEKSIKEEYLKLLDEGEAVRTYGFISDILKIFFDILIYGKYDTYNLCGETEISIYDLANKISSKFGKKTIKTKNTSLVGSPKKVKISLRRYYNEFGKNVNFTSLDEGLESTISWQKKIYGENYGV